MNSWVITNYARTGQFLSCGPGAGRVAVAGAWWPGPPLAWSAGHRTQAPVTHGPSAWPGVYTESSMMTWWSEWWQWWLTTVTISSGEADLRPGPGSRPGVAPEFSRFIDLDLVTWRQAGADWGDHQARPIMIRGQFPIMNPIQNTQQASSPGPVHVVWQLS